MVHVFSNNMTHYYVTRVTSSKMARVAFCDLFADEFGRQKKETAVFYKYGDDAWQELKSGAYLPTPQWLNDELETAVYDFYHVVDNSA